MNNIDILERITVTEFNTNNINDNIEKVNQAIKNLIAENKELKDENKCLKNKELDYMTVYLTGTYDERDKWKSKVEEKIKEYEEIGMIGVADCMKRLLDERSNIDEH